MTRVLLVTSNGTGMGHLTRQAAVALALRPEHEAVILTLSPAAPVVERLGIEVEYCPSYDRPWIAASDWDWYLRDRVVALVEEIGAQAVVFDGVAPYQGIGMASKLLAHVAFVWVRRGLWKTDVGSQNHLARSSYFDLVIEPGDLAQDADTGPTTERDDAVSVAPISMLEMVGPVSRSEARDALGLPEKVPITLVTLGSGMLGDVAGPGQIAIETVLRRPEWHVAVTRSSVATETVPLGRSSRVHEVRGVYPLVRYLKAFDAAVSSAGYNAVHELIPAGLPVVLVSNTSTRTDDQVLRANQVASRGLALAAEDSDHDAIEMAVDKLMSAEVRFRLETSAGSTVGSATGASGVAKMVVEFVESFGGSTRRRVSGGICNRIKSLTARLVGDRVYRWLRWGLRRSSNRPGRRTKAIVGDEALTVEGALRLEIAEDLPIELGRRRAPFEHVLRGTSATYSLARRDLISSYYDVRS